MRFLCWTEKKSEKVAQSCLTLQLHGLLPAKLLCPWNSPGRNTGVGSHSLLQGILLTQVSKLGLLHCRQILYLLSHQGSPILGLLCLKLFKSTDFLCPISKLYLKRH